MTLTTIKKAGLDDLALDHVFTIGASGTDHYTFQGEGLNGTVNDPTLYLTRGKTYRFEKGSSHPLRIQSTAGLSGTAYNTGVTNNGGTGTVILEVQHDAPDVLYYQCTSHAAMNGILYITGALADGGVTQAKLAAGSVTSAKIAGGAVDSTKIADLTIGAGKLSSNAVTTAKIADDAVTTDKIGNNAVSSGQINDNAVGSNQITSDAVVTSKIASGAVTTERIADNAVNMNKLSDLDNGRIIARVSSGSGNPEAATAAQIRTLLNVADGATAGGGKVSRVFQTTAGTVYQNQNWGDYMSITVSNVTADRRYLVFVSFNHQVQMTDYLAYSAFSTTHASPVGDNFNLSIGTNSGTSVRRNGFVFDTASSTNNRTYKVEHRSGSSQSNRRSILSSGVMVVLELDFS